jgi:hypothetical protein
MEVLSSFFRLPLQVPYIDDIYRLGKFMMDIANLGKELQQYQDKWIAIDETEEKIVGSGENAFEATENAERNGYQETILFKVPSFDSALIPMA